ncbi:MAG: TetR/AcrR family transcriptional regulator [Jiangellaceae bacterium]
MPKALFQHVVSRRERARAATIGEIKDTAQRLMHEQGTTDVRFSDIAREMGMTAPALYRYFADRDELLTALIVDAYDDLADAVATARDRVAVDDPGGRLYAVAKAYRTWARREPQRFALILGMPVPGYAAPPEGPTTEAARRAMVQLKSLFFDAAEQKVLRKPLLRDVDDSVHAFLSHKADQDDEPPLPAETFQALLHCWASMHGFTCLEAYGHLDFLPPAVRDAIFTSAVRNAATNAGLPPPR